LSPCGPLSIDPPSHQRSNSVDAGPDPTELSGTRRRHQQKSRDLSILSSAAASEENASEAISSSKPEPRQSPTKATPRRKSRSSLLPLMDGLDLFANIPSIGSHPQEPSLELQKTIFDNHRSDDDCDFLASAPSSSRFLLEETETPSTQNTDLPSSSSKVIVDKTEAMDTQTTEHRPQMTMTPVRMKGLKNFLGNTLIRKFQKGGLQLPLGDLSFHIGEIPKPVVVRSIETESLTPSRGQLPLMSFLKRNETHRKVPTPETPSRRVLDQRASWSKETFPSAATIGLHLLLLEDDGRFDFGGDPTLNKCGIMSDANGNQHIHGWSTQQAFPKETTSETIEAIERLPIQEIRESYGFILLIVQFDSS